MISTRKSLKPVVVVLSLILLGGVLSSCGASKEEKALEANCERIFSNLEAMKDAPEIFRNSSVADSDSVALLLGEDTRKSVEGKVIATYPILDEIIVGRAKDKQQLDPFYYAGAIYVIEKAIVGTDIEFPYTPEEMKFIAVQENGWRDTVLPLATKIFGDYMELTDHQGCAVIESEKEFSFDEKRTSVLFSWATDDYLDYASFLQAVRDCEVSGWHDGNKCSKNDYVSKPSTYTPSNELTPEEREILAERERDAQNGNQGSSGYSSATPGQLCNNVGEVVSTSNYGDLTCKIVFVRRLQVQMWMRS